MLRSSSELLGSELQALLSPCKSAACWRESPLLRSFEVKNSELWLQMGPASAVCGELGLPSLERGEAAFLLRRDETKPRENGTKFLEEHRNADRSLSNPK